MVAFLTETFPRIYIHTNIEQQQTLHELNAVIACITLKYHKCDLIRDTSLTSAAPCLPLPLLLLSVKKKPLRFQLFGWICASGSTHLLSKQLHCPSLPSSIAYLFLKSRPWSREEAGAPLTAHSRWVTCVIQEEGPETPSRPARAGAAPWRPRGSRSASAAARSRAAGPAAGKRCVATGPRRLSRPASWVELPPGAGWASLRYHPALFWHLPTDLPGKGGL